MHPLFTPPAGYPRIRIVDSFDALVTAQLGPVVNAVCWPRALDGDFGAVAQCLAAEEDIVSLDEAALLSLRPQLGAAGWQAAEVMIADLQRMAALGLQPSLECVPRYARDEGAILPTDVYSFHADRATVQADTYLCSYNEAASEGLRNEDAIRRVDMPEMRAKLLAECAEADFDAFLKAHCYDLHYAPRTGALPFSFGIGNLWRLAIEYPGCPVPPCIHRAPETVPGRPPRLLLIS
ncbi:MAG: hypothetical protein ACAH80_00970 [Alphaproteobacteria bacterium]